MDDLSILMGGKAGDGIRIATTNIARLLSRYGYWTFVYDDYPSLIRGGHNFSILRACDKPVRANKVAVDVVIAMDEQSIGIHAGKLKIEKGKAVLIYDSSVIDENKFDEIMSSSGVKSSVESAVDSNLISVPVPFKSIVKEEKGLRIMRNSAAIGGISKVLGVEWSVLEEVFKKFIPAKIEQNLAIAQKGYDIPETLKDFRVKNFEKEPLPVMSGNEAIALGAVKAGLDVYYAYPMTPSTSILHFLASASKKEKFDILVIHPENEIAVMLMALGSAYSGARTMVASSGGGIALMVEALSLSGQSEVPITLIFSQRAGPSTGVPTYTMQSDLHYARHLGHGEFPRFIVAPGDVEEAYQYTILAMNVSWKYQMPSIVLVDKHLSESNYTFDFNFIESEIESLREEKKPIMWGGNGEYRRYEITESGISPLAFPGGKSTVKTTSYEHDEFGITTEEPDMVAEMQSKRLRKRKTLEKELEGIDCVRTYNKMSGDTVIVTWGSSKGAVLEVAEELGVKVVQPIVMRPFPNIKPYFEGADKVICVEVNGTGQLQRLLENKGVNITHSIFKFNARPFFADELMERLHKEAGL